MDWSEIKDIIKEDGGKIIIVEDGTPTMAVISYEDFRKRTGNSAAGSRPASGEQSQNADTGKSPQQSEQRGEGELTIDDLPV